MVVVYRGKMPMVSQQFSGKTWVYRQAVPSYMSEAAFRKLKGDTFVEFDPKKPMALRGGSVRIWFPSHPHMAIASIYAAEKVRLSYPTCAIYGVMHPSVRRLLPDWINSADAGPQKDLAADIDLRPKQNHMPTDIRVLGHAVDWRRLMLIAGGLDEPRDDHQVGKWQPHLEGWNPVANAVGVVVPVANMESDPTKDTGQRASLSVDMQLLGAQLWSEGFKVVEIAYENENLEECINQMLDCRGLIALADSPLTYIAGAFGIPTVRFESKATTLNYGHQYKYLPSLKLVSLANAKSMEDGIETIVLELIDGIASTSIESIQTNDLFDTVEPDQTVEFELVKTDHGAEEVD